METCKIKNLYTLEETIAKPLFEGAEYPWELLPKISAFILELGATLSEDEMKSFLKEILPQIVPETYFTEQEIETVFALAEESMYDSDRYGSFYMSLQKDYSYTDEEQKCWSLELSSYASEAEDEEQAAGSYARTSAQYQDFMDFVEQNAVESEKD